MDERSVILRRINNTINTYAGDIETLRELERVVTGWFVMKRRRSNIRKGVTSKENQK